MLKKERPIIISISTIILIALLYVIFTLNKLTTYTPTSNFIAEKGTLDISNLDFNNDGYTALRGQWNFYWQQLLTPESLEDNPLVSTYMEMPMAWNKYNKDYSPTGYATYSLTIKLNSKYKDTLLGLSVPAMLTSYKLWVNGDLFSSNGVIDNVNASKTAKTNPVTGNFINTSENLHLVLQVSNYNFRDGGTFNDIYLGTALQMTNKREASIASEVFYFSILIIMGLYYLHLYTFNLRDATILYFGALCITMALRVLITSNTYFLSLQNIINYTFVNKLEYLTFYALTYFSLSYIYVVFKEYCSKRIIKACRYLCISFMITTIFISSLLASKFIIIFQIITLLIIIYTSFILFKALSNKKLTSLIAKFSYFIVILTSLASILSYLNLTQIGDYSLLVFFILMLANTFTLAMNQSEAYKKIESLSKEKEQFLLSDKLREVTFLLNSTLNLQEVLDKLLQSLKELVPYDSASFFMEENGQLKIVKTVGFSNVEKPYMVSINKKYDALFKEIYATNSPLALSNVKDDPRFKQYNGIPNIESWLGIPIIFKSKIIGILTLESTSQNLYTSYHSNVGLSFAYHAGIAIENAKLYGKTKQLASIDPLTNLYNRRSFFELANTSFNKSKELSKPISAIMIDIDNFKRINDKLGHHVGDLVLMRISKVCSNNLRANDILGRFGGEEFVVLLPNTNFEEAKTFAEDLRSSVENTPVIIRSSDLIQITCSFGVSTITPGSEDTDIDVLFIAADNSMYQAKAFGKNKVIGINLDIKS